MLIDHAELIDQPGIKFSSAAVARRIFSAGRSLSGPLKPRQAITTVATSTQCTAPIRATCAHGQPCQRRSYMMSGSSRKASKWLARQPRLHSQATA
jgi:hypothetical protein